MSNCGCESQTSFPVVSICDPCNTDTGCPIQIDWNCAIYHKSNNDISKLTCLQLTNGATLTQFAEAVDSHMCQLNILDYNLPCLRADYTINSLKQFAEAVDVEICEIKSDIEAVESLVNVPITPVDSQSVNLSVSGINNHTVQADVIVSSVEGNRLSVLSTGLFSSPQILSVDYSLKELTIVGGNTVSLAALFTPVSGFLGNVASDPSSPLNGQYWFRTDLPVASALKIRLNGTTRTIPTT